jgi:hypothetical protein
VLHLQAIFILMFKMQEMNIGRPGAHSAPYPMVSRAISSGIKLQGREADHSPPTSAEVKKMWIYTSIAPYACKA